jgi:hypothetical protein
MVQVSRIRSSPRASGLLSTQSDQESSLAMSAPCQVWCQTAPAVTRVAAIARERRMAVTSCHPGRPPGQRVGPAMSSGRSPRWPAGGRGSPRPTRRHDESYRRCCRGQQPNDQPHDQPQQDEPEHAHAKPSERTHPAAIPTHHRESLLRPPGSSGLRPTSRPDAMFVFRVHEETMKKAANPRRRSTTMAHRM